MKIVPYESKYYNRCLEIIQSNTPKYIDESEHADFENYLSKGEKTYFVVFKKSILIACGGYALNSSKTKAGLSWGLVHRDYHQQGIGRELLHFRIDHIKTHYPSVEIQLETSQHTYKFFVKFGFKLIKIEKNGWAKGLDKYDMKFIG